MKQIIFLLLLCFTIKANAITGINFSAGSANIIGNVSATSLEGNGSNLVPIYGDHGGDNLGNHVANSNLSMAGFDITTSSKINSIALVGVGSGITGRSLAAIVSTIGVNSVCTDNIPNGTISTSTYLEAESISKTNLSTVIAFSTVTGKIKLLNSTCFNSLDGSKLIGISSVAINTGYPGGFSIGTYPIDVTGYAAKLCADNFIGGPAGRILYQIAVSSTGLVAVGTGGFILKGNSGGAPSWFNATDSNTASTVVKRDSSGGFTSGIITASGFAFGGPTQTSGYSPVSGSSTSMVTLPLTGTHQLASSITKTLTGGRVVFMGGSAQVTSTSGTPTVVAMLEYAGSQIAISSHTFTGNAIIPFYFFSNNSPSGSATVSLNFVVSGGSAELHSYSWKIRED